MNRGVDMTKPRFSDVIKGIHASDSNPQQYGYYVETIKRTGRMNNGSFYRCTDGNGKFWEYPVSATKVIPRGVIKDGCLTNTNE